MSKLIALQADVDQRHAALCEWIWDQDAEWLCRLDSILSSRSHFGLISAMTADRRVANAVGFLAALALDDGIVRASGSYADADPPPDETDRPNDGTAPPADEMIPPAGETTWEN